MVSDSDSFEYLAVGPVDEFADGVPKLLQVHEKPVAIFRIGEEFFAIDDRCPHRGGPLSEGTIADGKITCPWHQAVYDLRSGDATSGNGKRLKTFRVSVQHDEVYLEIPPHSDS